MRMTSILTSNHISIHTRRRALECYIESILVYGCEAWTISKQNKRNWRQQKYSSYRESFESHGLQRNINETVLQEADTTRSHIILSKRQAIIFGYMLRKEKLEHLLISGMIEGKCSTGKQRKKMLDRITKWLKIGWVTESLKVMRDRDVLKAMITCAKEHDTWLFDIFDQIFFLIPLIFYIYMIHQVYRISISFHDLFLNLCGLSANLVFMYYQGESQKFNII